MLMQRGLEHGEHAGLGWIEGDVVPIATRNKPEWMQGQLRVPHMGWNTLELREPVHPCLADWQPQDHAYFVHSFHAQCTHEANILATCRYGGEITACIGRDNLLGTQFHPEKSGPAGLKLIENFVRQ
jgi:glutamine amidotransferase